jgi:hypothetical protein
MHRMWLVALPAILACSDGAVGSGQAIANGTELVPAEWTVFEDTSQAGEVTTASLQLPAAKGIEGLLDDKESRLILRCVDGQVQASIETDAGGSAEMLPIQLDSAPACE